MKKKLILFICAVIIKAISVSAQDYQGIPTWTVISLSEDGKAIPVNGYCISEKDPNIHFAVSKTTVLKSTDGGVNWNVVAEKVGGYQFWMNKMPVLIHPENPDIVYIGSLPGIMKSTDGGKTWSTKKASYGISILLFNSENPDEMWAASPQAGKTGGIYKSIDGGETWVQKLKKRPTLAFDISSIDNKTMYVGTGAGQYEKSIDGGETWESKKPKNGELAGLSSISGITHNPENPREMYLSANGLGIFKSTDGGEVWIHTGHYLDRDVKYNPRNASEVWGISNPNLGVLGGKGAKVHYSTDGGNKFVNTHADEMIKYMNDKYYDGKNAEFNNIYFSPDGGKVYICTSSGVIYCDSRIGK